MGQGKQTPPHGELSCSFCGKGQRAVRKLIAGPNVTICDECIALCHDIMSEELAAEPQRSKGAQALAALLIKACQADPRVPRAITDLAIALAVALAKHLDPPEG